LNQYFFDMAPKASTNFDLEQYFQYHNRLASFLDWSLEWEANEDKPPPERLARAGFFSFNKPPNLPDNVKCPYCELSLDSWEPQDEPLREHRIRSPTCIFVHGQQTVRDMSNGHGVHSVSDSDKKRTKEAARAKQACNRRAQTASKANGLDLAAANVEEAGQERPKRRPGRPKKKPAAG
jgi:hypothetical protein